MSYIPDYRKETDKLNEADRAFVEGYRAAMRNVECAFDNLDDKDALSIETEIIEKVKEDVMDYMECSETEVVCALFDNADYLPEDVELEDANDESRTKK